MPRTFSMLAVILFAIQPTAARGGDWPLFRGPQGTGVSTETGVPLAWSADKNVVWRVALPGPGNSSPIVSRGRVFVTCAHDHGRRRGLYCFDRQTGRELWSQVVDFEGDEPTHETNPYCGSSPAADGTRVVVWHGSAGVYCYDYEGGLVWSHDLGKFRHIWGYGSSPVFYRDRILLNCGPGKRTFVTALAAATGDTIWQADEPGGDDGADRPGEKPIWVGSWSTPVVAKIDGRDQVLVSLPHHVRAYDPHDGRVLWSCGGLGDLDYTSVVVGDVAGVAMSGYFGPAIGFKLGGSGDTTESNRLWHSTEKNPQRIGSGVILGEQMFLVDEPGTVECLDVTTGRVRWKERLTGEKVWASPIATDGRLYVTDQAGTTFVFAPNPDKFELLARNEIGEPSNSTLAISDGRIFLRTFEHLICIGE